MEWLATLLAVVLIALLLRGSGVAQEYRLRRRALGRSRSARDYGEMAGWGALSLTGGPGYWCEDVRG